MDATDNRESCLKELPTRELKLKRHKVRRDSLTIPPIRLRLKSSSSSMNETDFEKCLSDRSMSSSPDSVTEDHSPVSPSSPVTNESCEAFTLTDSDTYDQPLDMSRKRTQYSADSTTMPLQQLRPSVITCASALLRTQCNLSDLAHNMCTMKANCDDVDLQKKENTDLSAARLGHRREIVSGSCDPVIDEHFRRSLGKDYQNIFSKSSGNNVSITVDDHFAKALGETWHQLQQSKTSVASVPPAHSSSSIQAQQPPQFLHQSPEILS